ncbi:hypothetical protein Tco_0837744 [Tanacetum coccineum]
MESFELFRSTYPGRHVARETYPQRQVARDTPDLSLGNMANVVVSRVGSSEPEAASLPLVGVGLSTSQPPPYTVEDGIGTHNSWKTVLELLTYLRSISRYPSIAMLIAIYKTCRHEQLTDTTPFQNVNNQRYEDLEQERTINRCPLATLLEVNTQNYQVEDDDEDSYTI